MIAKKTFNSLLFHVMCQNIVDLGPEAKSRTQFIAPAAKVESFQNYMYVDGQSCSKLVNDVFGEFIDGNNLQRLDMNIRQVVNKNSLTAARDYNEENALKSAIVH